MSDDAEQPTETSGEPAPHRPSQPTVLVMMGVSGSGKTTVAKTLVDELDWEFEEGDSLHPAANVEKMRAGHPLTDEDRWPWLERIAEWIKGEQAKGGSGIITCSALRKVYRDKLRGPGVWFVFLHGSQELIADRLAKRKGHYMPPSLLQSQFDTLEIPDDEADVITVELGGTPQEEADRTLKALRDKGILD
ncbi:gluconokinase [Nakamurella aerolata]|uniref:Gluconokinase n=1 Tax=Nakamurella aerolata TaxID=1656892 RepID=A0A849AEH2_9ACTN|nr:gluconokinase [Nakamurella aerolata]NNG37611.1 gluconokinase [Nakamurella aerolata]